MAEHGEWNQKGATLSDKTAIKDYGIDREFMLKGIRAGKLEFQERSIYGNPYVVILRRQLEQYIAEELGSDHLSLILNQKKRRTLKKEIKKTRLNLQALELELAALEKKG